MISAGQGVSSAALQSLATAGQELVHLEDLDAALGALAAAAASGTGATLAVIRVEERGGADLQTRGVWAASRALRAELEGSRLPAGAIGTQGAATEADDLPEAVSRLARRWGATRILVCPVATAGKVVATLELARAGEPFSGSDVLLARLIVNHSALLVRAIEPANGTVDAGSRTGMLELAGWGLWRRSPRRPGAASGSPGSPSR